MRRACRLSDADDERLPGRRDGPRGSWRAAATLGRVSDPIPLCPRRWRGLVCPALAILVLIGVVLAYSMSRARAARSRERVARYFSGVRLEPSAPIHARVGERWTFRVASLYDRGAGIETWDVLEVTPTSVQCRVTPIGGGSSRVETWSFAAPVRTERVVGGERDVVHVGGRSFSCDVAEVVVPPGVDWVRAWIAVDPATGQLTFPGVVRLDRTELRGRRKVEWDLVSIGPMSSASAN